MKCEDGTKRPMRMLLSDIVIPAGTVFYSAPAKTERYGDEHYECIIGLTKDSHGSLVYCIDKDDPELEKWFR